MAGLILHGLLGVGFGTIAVAFLVFVGPGWLIIDIEVSPWIAGMVAGIVAGVGLHAFT